MINIHIADNDSRICHKECKVLGHKTLHNTHNYAQEHTGGFFMQLLALT